MLVKRDNLISGNLEPYSEPDDLETSWPDNSDLPAPIEPSGFRPAPPGLFDPPSPLPEHDEAAASGLPTPREPRWSAEPASTTPLPVVTATSEPTQRGLGIPPPPSSQGAEWLSNMPPLTSVAPLTLDTFEEDTRGAAAREDSLATEPLPEPSENERITVRAPASPRPAKWRRRRAIAAVVAAAAIVVGFVARRVSSFGDGTGASAGAAPAQHDVSDVAAAGVAADGVATKPPASSTASTPEADPGAPEHRALVHGAARPRNDERSRVPIEVAEPASSERERGLVATALESHDRRRSHHHGRAREQLARRAPVERRGAVAQHAPRAAAIDEIGAGLEKPRPAAFESEPETPRETLSLPPR